MHQNFNNLSPGSSFDGNIGAGRQINEGKDMCGILGTIGYELTHEQYQAGLEKIHHRGPDEQGIYKGPEVVLGHTRLSIMDLEGGSQPLYSEDENIVCVCNGELYEFEKVRLELEQKGHKFSTHSDSEILIHLYEEYGIEFLKYLRGEFAFLLFDKTQQILIACRDRFGIKPLYFTENSGKYAFASESKAFFGMGILKPEINVEAIRNILHFVQTDCIFKNIKAIPPAHYLKINLENKSAETVPYWNLDLGHYEEIVEPKKELLKELEEAVKIRMRADVPLGVYLSGGLDSSAIASIAAKYHQGPIETFTIAFTENGDFNEARLAKKTATKIGANYNELTVTSEDLLKQLEDSLWFSEYPTTNLHGVGKFMLSELARKKVKTVLTGEGGDEQFLGYDYFDLNSKLPSFSNISGRKNTKELSSRVTKRAKELEDELKMKPLLEIVAFQSKWYKIFLNKLFNRKFYQQLGKTSGVDSLKEQLQKCELEGKDELCKRQGYSIRAILAPYILTVLGDRQEMGHSLEGRTPLLDHKLFEFVRRLKPELKREGNKEKKIFKEVMRPFLIPEIYERKKWAYFAPQVLVKKGENPTMDALIDKYLKEDAILNAGVFDFSFVKRLQFYLKILSIFGGQWQARLNSLLFFILAVQIIQIRFNQEFGSL